MGAVCVDSFTSAVTRLWTEMWPCTGKRLCVCVWGGGGSPCGQFHKPGHAAMDGDVAVYRSVYVGVLGGGGSPRGQFHQPGHAAMDGDVAVYR